MNEKALPLPRQHQLLDLVIGRLQDKSSSVRKCALQLLTAVLRMNPFAAKVCLFSNILVVLTVNRSYLQLPLEELKEGYEKESAKLREMQPEEPQLTAAGQCIKFIELRSSSCCL